MNRLKRLAASLVTLTFVFAFTSCEKQISSDSLQEVSFNVNNVTDQLKKAVGSEDENIPACKDIDVAYVVANIDGTDYKLDILTGLNDGTETQVVKLESGTYSLDGFKVYSANDELLWVAPASGSYYADLWNLQGVSLDFEVGKFTKTKIDVDVLCWEDFDYQKFGFNWFDFQEVTIKTICFFGDVCTPNYEDWGEDHMDFVAQFRIKIFDGNLEIAKGVSKGQNEPVCIEYPEFADRTDDIYTVKVWALNTPYGNTYLGYMNLDANTGILYDPDGNDISTNDINGDLDEDGIIDLVFYEGENCNYSGNAGVNYIQEFGTNNN